MKYKSDDLAQALFESHSAEIQVYNVTDMISPGLGSRFEDSKRTESINKLMLDVIKSPKSYIGVKKLLSEINSWAMGQGGKSRFKEIHKFEKALKSMYDLKESNNLDVLNESKKGSKIVKKNFGKIKLKETWEEDVETLSKDDLVIPTKWLSLDVGLIGKENYTGPEYELFKELQEYICRKKNRSVSELEIILKRFLKSTYSLFEFSDMRVVFKSQKNKKKLIEMRYNKKLKKTIDTHSNDVIVQEVEVTISKDDIKVKANTYRKADASKIPEARKTVEKGLSIEVKPIKEQPISIEVIMDEGGVDKDTAVKVGKVSTELFKQSISIEPRITKDLVSIVALHGCKMYGLDFRLKQQTSLGRKLACDARELGSLEAAASNIKDSIRYTAILNFDNFTNTYFDIKDALESKGYVEFRCKNFYLKYSQGKSQQKSIQCVYQDVDSGVMFELQFHTLESQSVKEINHPMYEKFRASSTPPEERGVLDLRMTNLGEEVEDPLGVLSIPEHDKP